MRFLVWLTVVVLGCSEHGSTPDGQLSDSRKSDGIIVLEDASSTCLDDSAFEPNDSIATAFITPVANQAQTFSALASICPAGDKDTYEVTLSTTSTLRVTTSWTNGGPVNASILNQGGTSIANSVAHGADAHCVCLDNLPAGTFFASVFAASQNDYQIEIKIVTPAECSAPPACN